MKPEDLVTAMLKHIGEDPTRDGLAETPDRVVRSWAELFSGYKVDPGAYLAKKFKAKSSQMVTITDIDFFSTCEHHLMPFHGTVDIAYIPIEDVSGLSKFARVVEAYARRLQIQERLTYEIADVIDKNINTLGVAVRVRSQHLCMAARGVRSPTSRMTTTELRGKFREDTVVRQEWLIGLPK